MDEIRDGYNSFYKHGGWRKDVGEEEDFLSSLLFRPLGLSPPLDVLDIGCGTGEQAAAMTALGYNVLGVDLSSEGIAWARKWFSDTKFLCKDAADVTVEDGGPFDLIFARGMSWYHYDLDAVVFEQTRKLVRLLKPGGLFALLIRTDFSGTVEPKPGAIVNNRLSDYQRLFAPLGEIVLCTDWNGNALTSDDGAQGARNIIIVTRPAAKFFSYFGDEDRK